MLGYVGNVSTSPMHIVMISYSIAAPSHVSAQAMSSDSIKVSWTPAQTASSVSVTYYINASSSTYQTVSRTVTDPDREVLISGLHPFTKYYITVQAGNPGGLSEPTGRSATTLTAGEYQSSCHKLLQPYRQTSNLWHTHVISVTIYSLGMQ